MCVCVSSIAAAHLRGPGDMPWKRPFVSYNCGCGWKLWEYTELGRDPGEESKTKSGSQICGRCLGELFLWRSAVRLGFASKARGILTNTRNPDAQREQPVAGRQVKESKRQLLCMNLFRPTCLQPQVLPGCQACSQCNVTQVLQ